MNKYVPLLLAFTALMLSAVSGYFSIFGLSRLFTGAGISIIIMAAVMEVSKIIITVYLHRFWGKIYMLLKLYLLTAVVALVIITSMGAYGFLTSGFQASSLQLELYQIEVTGLEARKDFFSQELDVLNRDLDRIQSTVQQLSTTRSTAIQVRDTSAVGGVRQTISTFDTRLASERLEEERRMRDLVMADRQSVLDSLRTYQSLILNHQLEGRELVEDIGPFQFVAELTGRPVVEIVNIIIILLVLVLDPLAISMILASSIGLRPDRVPVLEENKEETVKNLEDPTPTTILKSDILNSGAIVDNDNNGDSILDNSTSSGSRDEDEIPSNLWEKYNQELAKLSAERKKGPVPIKILQKTPSFVHVLMSDGTRKKVSKKDDIIRYL